MGLKQRKSDSYMNSPQGIRANAEAAGFNPLVFAGPGTGTGASYAPRFGSAVAEAGAALASGMVDDEALKIQKAELELENRRLTEQIKNNQLRAKVPGIYGQRSTNSTIRDGDPSGSPYSQDKEALRAIPERNAHNLYIDVYDSQTKRWITIVNPELIESGPIEMAAGLATLGAADAVQNGILGLNKDVPPGKRSSRRERRKSRTKQPKYGWMPYKFGSFNTN